MPDPTDHDELTMLLPFYANGTLGAVDKARIDAALARSGELRAALAEQREVLGLVRRAGQQWSQAAPGQTPPVISATRNAVPAGLLQFLSPANWHPTVALGLALAIVAQAGGLLVQRGTIGDLRDENYQLASGATKPPVKGGILIELADDARWGAVTQLLEAEGLSIASSADFGVLIVTSGKEGADQTALIARLRGSTLIASAEPAA
jgi:hypothetical protein